MMDRRDFLKLTGLVAAASALEALPAAAAPRANAVLAERARDLDLASGSASPRLTVREPGTYRISGRVRLDGPQVEIGGIAHPQRISWSDAAGHERPVAEFTTFEHFDRPGMTAAIHVQGGRLEALTLQAVDFE